MKERLAVNIEGALRASCRDTMKYNSHSQLFSYIFFRSNERIDVVGPRMVHHDFQNIVRRQKRRRGLLFLRHTFSHFSGSVRPLIFLKKTFKEGSQMIL